MTARKMERAVSSNESGGPLVVSFRLERPTSNCNDECRFDLELPHNTTTRKLAAALRAAAYELEAMER